MRDGVAHQFLPATIPELEQVEFHTFYPTESAIAYLISGVKRAVYAGPSSTHLDNGRSVERGSRLYVALFHTD